jgi:hypothetical protein
MNNTIFATLIAAMMGGVGAGSYVVLGEGGGAFDFQSASASERTAYLEKKAGGLHNKFKPNYLSKKSEYGVRGDTVQLTYNTGMGSVACGKGVNCEVMQCQRYLKNSVRKYNVSVKLLYTDNRSRRIGSQSLSTNSCEAKIERWDAGADRRKAEKARNQKEVCNDDYIGMKPVFGC